jgi:hypothetical protein
MGKMPVQLGSEVRRYMQLGVNIAVQLTGFEARTQRRFFG